MALKNTNRFQFHYGSIIRAKLGDVFFFGTYFNSTMVQLLVPEVKAGIEIVN